MGTHVNEFNLSNIKPKRILAHWKHKMTVTHTDDGNMMCVCADLLIGRTQT